MFFYLIVIAIINKLHVVLRIILVLFELFNLFYSLAALWEELFDEFSDFFIPLPLLVGAKVLTSSHRK